MSGSEPQRRSWSRAPVLSVAALSLGAGIAAFGTTVVIADVAAAFGTPGAADDPAGRIGLPVTTVGVALAIIRLASLGSLPLAALADRLGRRRVLLSVAGLGLGLTSIAAASPGFWWYVALVAVARPCLSALNAVAGVVAAEESRADDRAGAIGLIAAAYGLGAGVVAVGRGLWPGGASFRVVTAFTLVPLLLLPIIAARTREPTIARERVRRTGLPGSVPRDLRGRVVLLALLVGAIAVATGPGFTYLFVFGEGVLGVSSLWLATLVLAAGPVGLAGILVGRWAADRLGRRLTGALALAGTGLAVAVAYSGAHVGLAAGYLATVLLASAFAPAQGAMAAELVPTANRATTAAWLTVTGVLGAVTGLTVFGVVADATGGFATGAIWIGGLVAVSAVGFVALPETRGLELEDLEISTATP